MVNVLLPPLAKLMFFISLCGYLFGDLAIYYKAIGQSLVDFTWYVLYLFSFIIIILICDCKLMYGFIKLFSDLNANKTLNKSDLCWEKFSYTKHDIYLSYLVRIRLYVK